MMTLFFIVNVLPDSQGSESLVIQGSYLGVDQIEVTEIYNQLEKDEVAGYLSWESDNSRDLITVTNEFSSMGNKSRLNTIRPVKPERLVLSIKLFPFPSIPER